MNGKILTRTALMLGLTIIFQSLRLLIPLPVFLSTFLIGSLVNASFLITYELVGLWSAMIIVTIAPIVAYFQGMLLLPVFIVPVAIGNAVLVLVYHLLRNIKKAAVFFAAFTKTLVLYSLFTWLLTFIVINPKIAAALMFAMSWPQFVTGIIGGVLSLIVVAKYKKTIK